MLEILKPMQKEYEETSFANKQEDKTPMICGYYGRACRVTRFYEKSGSLPVFSMLCGLCWGKGKENRSSGCCPIQALFYDKYVKNVTGGIVYG